jgi:hypothetical protein
MMQSQYETEGLELAGELVVYVCIERLKKLESDVRSNGSSKRPTLSGRMELAYAGWLSPLSTIIPSGPSAY